MLEVLSIIIPAVFNGVVVSFLWGLLRPKTLKTQLLIAWWPISFAALFLIVLAKSMFDLIYTIPRHCGEKVRDLLDKENEENEKLVKFFN